MGTYGRPFWVSKSGKLRNVNGRLHPTADQGDRTGEKKMEPSFGQYFSEGWQSAPVCSGWRKSRENRTSSSFHPRNFYVADRYSLLTLLELLSNAGASILAGGCANNYRRTRRSRSISLAACASVPLNGAASLPLFVLSSRVCSGIDHKPHLSILPVHRSRKIYGVFASLSDASTTLITVPFSRLWNSD